MNSLKKCEKCGLELQFRKEGSTQGLYCLNCGWIVVTTYIPKLQLDRTNYRVYVTGADFKNVRHIQIISKIYGMNYIVVKKLLQEDKPLVFEGYARDVIKIREKLSLGGIGCEIIPEFNY